MSDLRDRLVRQALTDALSGTRAECEGVLLALECVRAYLKENDDDE